MALTDAQLLEKIETQIGALLDGTDAESITVGEETIRGVRLRDLMQQRDELRARGVAPSSSSSTTSSASFHLGVFDEGM